MSVIDGKMLQAALASPNDALNPGGDPATVAQQLGRDFRAFLGGEASQLRLFTQGAMPYLRVERCFLVKESLTPTPMEFPPDWSLQIVRDAACAALGVIGALGLDPVSYQSENMGASFVNLTARPGSGRSAEKARSGLRGHTDGVCLPFPHEHSPGGHSPAPDFVVLVGIRNPDAVPTKVIPLSGLLDRLNAKEIQCLEEPSFAIGAQLSFTALKGYVNYDVPVMITDPQRGVMVRFSNSVVAGMDEQSTAVATKITRLLEQQIGVERVVVAPGDVVIINNRTALHGRDSIGSDVGNSSRWLLRTYGMKQDTPRTYIDGSSFVLKP